MPGLPTSTLLRLSVALALLLVVRAQAGEVLRESFRSQRLGRDIAYTSYLPDAARGPAARPALQVIYLLHGAGGNESSWVRDGRLAASLDEAMRDAAVQGSAVVMPSLGPHTWWIDGAADAAATAFVTELMPHAEARLPFVVRGGARAIAGVSMGGFGALHLALRHPQLFCAAALVSPAVYDPSPPAQSAAWRSAQFARKGVFDVGLWQAASHPAQMAAYRESPDKVPIWIVSGDHDDLGIAWQSVQLFERLRAIQPDRTELRIVDGGHDEPTFAAALPGALAFIKRRCRT